MSADRYSRGAIVLHWLIALLIVGQIAGGFYMEALPDSDAAAKFRFFQLHKSFGLTILALSLVRLGWRLTHRPPALPAGMAGWERIAARATHAGFYALMIGAPLIGWAYVSVAPFNVPTVVFGVLPWPHLPLGGTNAALAETLSGLHGAAAWGFIGLLALHVGAALKHHFINRDDVLARMLPIVRRRSKQ